MSTSSDVYETCSAIDHKHGVGKLSIEYHTLSGKQDITKCLVNRTTTNFGILGKIYCKENKIM